MCRFSFVHFALAAVVAAVVFGASSARAANNQSWVASDGSGAACTRSAPCPTFQSAFNATVAGGEINCVDAGNFGNLAITHSITINCNATNGAVNFGGISITTAATDIVVLKGLDIDLDGTSSGSIGQSGLIIFTGAGVLHVENTRINGTKGNVTSGILFVPNGPAKLIVADSSITNIGTTGTPAGIYIRPNSGATVDVAIERSRIDGNFFGIIADGSGTGGGIIRGIVSDSFVTNNVHNGITVSTSGSSTVLTVDNTKVSGNSFGLVAGGSGAGLLVGRSVINANATGLFSTGGGALLSYRDNRVNGNTTTDGAFTGFVNTQ